MIFDSIIERVPIHKGWSGDKKYCVTTNDGSRYFLRIAAIERRERFYRCYQRMMEAAALQVPMCLPVEFGTCHEGAYAIHSWVDGVDAEVYIPALSPRQQYTYGLDAGRILQRFHTLPAPADAQPWAPRFNAKIDRKIAMYEACPLKYEKGECFLGYLSENRHLLKDRPQCFQHGDYHIGNMMVDSSGILTVIDFDRDDYGDPWEEFNRIVWCAQESPLFASGMVDGYFSGNVPYDFWQLLALYIASNTLSSLPWAVPFGDEEISTMKKQAAEVLRWYDDMRQVVPTWYQKP